MEDGIVAWAASAPPGAMVEYYHGDLAFDRENAARMRKLDMPIPSAMGKALDDAHDAYKLMQDGRLLLTQAHEGSFVFSYRATRAKQP